MKIHHLVPSASRWLLSMGSILLAAGHASGADLSKFKRIEPQFIAALGDPSATSGNGAQAWGFWNQDPGPRACKLDHYSQLKATGVAPAQWKFDASDWWLEEHGLIMEKPTFPLPAGQYLVTGDRDVETVLTVHPKDKNGNQRWELADGSTLYDVTHLGCRSARYTPAKAANACSPANAPTKGFPVTPGAASLSVFAITVSPLSQRAKPGTRFAISHALIRPQRPIAQCVIALRVPAVSLPCRSLSS
jgi:hypothetical protein